MINKVILVGRLGKDPEVRHLENGAVVANFSVATSERYRDKEGNKQEKTEWHNVVVWRQLAEIAEKFLRKGGLVYIEGKLRTRSWDDKDGNKKYTTEVVAENFQMLDRKREENAMAVGEAEIASDGSSDEVKDDLPF
jgi:single-strand DNA-binding protein